MSDSATLDNQTLLAVRKLMQDRMVESPILEFDANEAAAAVLIEQLSAAVTRSLFEMNCLATARLVVTRINAGDFPDTLADVRAALGPIADNDRWPELPDTLANCCLTPSGGFSIAAILQNATPESLKALYQRSAQAVIAASVRNNRPRPGG